MCQVSLELEKLVKMAGSSEPTAYDTEIVLEHEGIEYHVKLHWDSNDGYELIWRNAKREWISSPDWAVDIDNLCQELDEIAESKSYVGKEVVNTARQQFVQDFLLVAMNDYETYRHVQDSFAACENGVYELADRMQLEFDTFVSDIAYKLDQSGNTFGALVISQLLANQGLDTWTDIAKGCIAE